MVTLNIVILITYIWFACSVYIFATLYPCPVPFLCLGSHCFSPYFNLLSVKTCLFTFCDQGIWKISRKSKIRNCSIWKYSCFRGHIPRWMIMISFQDFNNQREHLVDADYRLKKHMSLCWIWVQLVLWWFFTMFLMWLSRNCTKYFSETKLFPQEYKYWAWFSFKVLSDWVSHSIIVIHLLGLVWCLIFFCPNCLS